MRIAQPLETQLGTQLHPLELASQLMLWLLHIQDMLSMFSLTQTIELHQLPTHALTQTKLPPMTRIVPLQEIQLGTPSPPLEQESQLMLWLLHIQDMLSISNTEVYLNSTLVQVSIISHHTFQPTMPTQKFTMEEPRLHQPLRPKLLQLIPLPQNP